MLHDLRQFVIIIRMHLDLNTGIEPKIITILNNIVTYYCYLTNNSDLT